MEAQSGITKRVGYYSREDVNLGLAHSLANQAVNGWDTKGTYETGSDFEVEM